MLFALVLKMNSSSFSILMHIATSINNQKHSCTDQYLSAYSLLLLGCSYYVVYILSGSIDMETVHKCVTSTQKL